MKAIILDSLPTQALKELDELYHSTKLARLRTRVQMILLSAEQKLKAARIADLVRDNERTVQRWLQRYQQKALRVYMMHQEVVSLEKSPKLIKTSCSRASVSGQGL